MPTHITQIEDTDRNTTILRVEGQIARDDAVLVERIARELRTSSGTQIAIDLADVDLIDSEAAAVLKRLTAEGGFEITGIEILLQNAVNEVERQ